MRSRAGPQFVLGFGEGDIEAALAQLCPFEQEAEGHGGLPGARAAFQEKDPAGGQAAQENIVETRDTRPGFGRHPAHRLLHLSLPNHRAIAARRPRCSATCVTRLPTMGSGWPV